MYEVRCIVGDKKLHDVLTTLKGQTLEHPVVIAVGDKTPSADQYEVAKPVQKAAKKYRKPLIQGGKHRAGKGAIEIIRAIIANPSVSRVSARQLRKAVEAAGYSKGTYSHPLKVLTKEGSLKPLDTLGDFEVVRKAHAAEAAQNG